MKRAAAWGCLGLWLVLFAPSLEAMVTTWVGRSGLAVVAVVAAVFAALPGAGRWARRALVRPSTPVFVGVVAALCAAISLWVVVARLQGKVLVLDSSVYLLQARALTHGELGIPVETPAAYASVRFLFEGPDGRIFGVFPPGFPLYVAPFVKLGLPMLVGPVTAALLVVAQHALARAAGEPEEVARASLLLMVPSYARAIETADLLSHAFVALLAVVALTALLRWCERPTAARALLVGACAGWVLSARLLDGVVLLGVLTVGVAIGGRRAGWGALGRGVAVALLGMLPFVALLLVQQKTATGHWLRPSQSEFFLRSDFPPTCHRLGFGPDVGCSVEHYDERLSFGKDGYTLDDALRVGRDRAVTLGFDLFGVSPLLLLGLVALVMAPSGPALLLALWWVGLGWAYLLFYYGNAPAFGARHLFPVAPVIYVLTARLFACLPRRAEGARRFDAGHVFGGAMLALLLIATLSQTERWRRSRWILGDHQAQRANIHAESAKATQAIVVTDDTFGFMAAFDPWRDRGVRRVAPDDFAGVIELRRQHPDWPVLRVTPTGLVPLEGLPPVTPGLEVELELAWPSLVRPQGLGTRRVDTMSAVKAASSGGSALAVQQAVRGGLVDVPFDVLSDTTLRLWIEGVAGPHMGRYEVTIDGVAQPAWDGYGSRYEPRRGEPGPPMELRAGRHWLRLRCVDKDARSAGLLALFDRLRGAPP